jgi:hypothetical protein
VSYWFEWGKRILSAHIRHGMQFSSYGELDGVDSIVIQSKLAIAEVSTDIQEFLVYFPYFETRSSRKN